MRTEINSFFHIAANRCRRWGDNDRQWGPFTYAHSTGYKPIGIVLDSGDDEYPYCCLRVQLRGHTLIVELPSIIKPARSWVDLRDREWAKNDGYWDCHAREYGFNISEGFLNVSYGAQTHDSSTNKSWGYFLPWTQWRHARHSLYDLDGKHWITAPKHKGIMEWIKIKDRCPSKTFLFADFDGEEIHATTRIEEREWLFGEGGFKWLSLFRPAKIRRTLYIEFSAETGQMKGSWKGGTLGHGIDMRNGELHEKAFRRYCAENKMVFIRQVIAEEQHP